jgi:hypothetical protein
MVSLSPEIFVVIRPPALASLGRNEVYRIKQGGFDLPRITLSAGRSNPLRPAFSLHCQPFLYGVETGKIIVVEEKK